MPSAIFIPPETAPESGTTFLNVSVHRFADAESAANAMVVFSDQVIFDQGLQEVEPRPSARALGCCRARPTVFR